MRICLRNTGYGCLKSILLSVTLFYIRLFFKETLPLSKLDYHAQKYLIILDVLGGVQVFHCHPAVFCFD
jgi:hypothetical protein